MTRFNLADLERANDDWGCNCGPGSLAAILDLTLDEVRPLFEPGRPFSGYTNPTLMFSALRVSRRRHHEIGPQPWAAAVGRPWPQLGICRVQWGGPWMAPNVPAAARYRATHWIGVCRVQHGVNVWDVNLIGNELHSDGWCPLEWWSATLVPLLTSDIKRADGRWHITHSVEVERSASATERPEPVTVSGRK